MPPPDLTPELTPSEGSVDSRMPKIQHLRGSAGSDSASSVSSVPANGIDIRLHGNQVHIGGCWGTVDVSDAIKLNQKSRSNRPHLPRIVPLGSRVTVKKGLEDADHHVFRENARIADSC